MKKTITLCVSALLLIGGLNANPVTKSKSLLFGYNQPAPSKIMINALAPKKKKGGNWNEGDMLFAVGYGFPNMGKTLLKSATGVLNFKATGFGPLHFRFEYALSESFGIGISSNFNKFGWSDDYTGQVYNSTTGQYDDVVYHETVDWTSVNFLVRFNKHWAAGSKADIFSGAGFGYNYRKYSYTSTEAGASGSFKNPIPIGFEWTIGCRIFFTPNFIGYVEAGYAKDIIQVGIAYKIGS
ncbi:MAG TPA: hypothetical protein VFJ43_11460 [Bacteroidia bacterium]|nr:hypothetical protein [Bacteroidia bacterium]